MQLTGTGDDFSTYTNSFTVEAWIRRSTTPAATRRMTIFSVAGAYGLYLDSNNALVVEATFNGSVNVTGNGTVVPDGWTHVALVYEQTRQTLTAWVNGSPGTPVNVPVTNGNIQVNSAAAYIGSATGQPFNDRFEGDIDELRVSNLPIYAGAGPLVPESRFTYSPGSTVALFHFDERSGTHTSSYTSKVITATVTGGATLAGQCVPRHCGLLDATGGYFLSQNGSALNVTAGFTVEAWVWRDSTAAVTAPILQRSGIFTISTNGGLPAFTLYCANGSYSASGNSAWPNGRWVHLALTIDSGIPVLYLDGHVAATGAAGCNQPTTSTAQLQMGQASGGFIGYLDDFRFSTPARYVAAFIPPSETTVDGTALSYFGFDQSPPVDGRGTVTTNGIPPLFAGCR